MTTVSYCCLFISSNLFGFLYCLCYIIVLYCLLCTWCVVCSITVYKLYPLSSNILNCLHFLHNIVLSNMLYRNPIYSPFLCYIIALCYCIHTIILCLPTFFTCLNFLHNILLSNMLYRNPIYTPSFDTYPVSHNYFEVVIV